MKSKFISKRPVSTVRKVRFRVKRTAGAGRSLPIGVANESAAHGQEPPSDTVADSGHRKATGRSSRDASTRDPWGHSACPATNILSMRGHREGRTILVETIADVVEL